MELSKPDPVTEWSSSGAQIGLEEPMWELGLGSGSDSYPERPDEADCIYYLRTGFCGYGSRCRFNHPRDRGSVFGAMRASAGEYPERMGQPVCQYYMRTGMCKFGASCKYHHPRQGIGSSSTVPLNVSGYPLRPGEKECSYYVKTGQCKFGVTCKFHHPQAAGMVPPPVDRFPALAGGPFSGMPSTIYPNVQPNWPYIPGVLIPPGIVPFSGWNPYQLSPSAPSYTGSYFPSSSKSRTEHVFPERPGEPECQFYMKTGDCKFGSSCRYHHPPESTVPKINFALSPMGLPLRPGAPLCSHYAQNGVCKLGPSCTHDHPMGTLSYSPSASSLADMPVAPYPISSSVATLAPSSSSSELNSAPRKDNVSTSMPSASIGSSIQLSQSTGSSTTSHDARSVN